MEKQVHWTVDLGAGLASQERTVIRFDCRADHAFDFAFVAGGECSLEEQCLIAGEAAAAIRARMARP